MIALTPKLSIRYFIKNRKYTIINILGLSLGLATFYIIAFLIYYNLSFDQYQKNYQTIYRVDQKVNVSGHSQIYPCSPFGLANNILVQFPEIKCATRIMYCSEFLSSDTSHTFWENNGIYADSNFLEVFDYDIIKGSPKLALKDTSAILINETLAHKYFPGKSPLGRILKFQTTQFCKVTGVFKDLPGNSNLNPDYIVAFPVLRKTLVPDFEEKWDWCMASTFVILDTKTNTEQLSEKIDQVITKYWKFPEQRKTSFWPLKKIRTQYSGDYDSRPILIIFGIIAFLVLIIASINFTNLSVSYSINRQKEITLKTIFGANKFAISRMFISETIIFTFISLIFALGISEIAVPWLNKYIEFDLEALKWDIHKFTLFIFIISTITAIISGIFPALILTSIPITKSIRSNTHTVSKNPVIRKILVTFQFILSTALIATSMVCFLQMNYLKKINLGITSDNILIGYFQLQGKDNIARYQQLKSELLSNKAISEVSWMQNAPFYRTEWWDISIEGKKNSQKYHVQHNHVDFDYLKTFDIQLLYGKNFSPNQSESHSNQCIVNERAAEIFGWGQNAIGKHIYNDHNEYEIIGIMNNYYIMSVMQPIEPCFISYTTRQLSWPNTHAIRIKNGYNPKQIKNWITQKFRKSFPEANLEFSEYNDIKHAINFGYIEVLNFLITLFSLIAIIIASTGLYGQVSFITRQRTKEIGVRKVNGAVFKNIYLLIAKEFIYLLLFANIAAIPLSYLLSRFVLLNFANHISLGFSIFILTFIISLLITLITISFEIFKACKSNPIDSLRYE